jgi:hypothetical protein
MGKPGITSIAVCSVELLSLFLTGCHARATKDTKEFSVEEWLNVCSPFYSLDGQQLLMFRDADHTVTLHKIDRTRDPSAKGILETKYELRERGTWTTDKRTGQVLVDVAGKQASYTLVVPYEFQCVLGAGQIEAVNLKSSWYGTPAVRRFFDLCPCLYPAQVADHFRSARNTMGQKHTIRSLTSALPLMTMPLGASSAGAISLTLFPPAAARGLTPPGHGTAYISCPIRTRKADSGQSSEDFEALERTGNR